MKCIFLWALLVLSFTSLVSQENRFVLLIGIDGCRPDALKIANTPHLDGLIGNGFFSPNALNDDITISGPGWSSILCGTRSDKHLVTNNDFSDNNFVEYPSVFRHIKSERPDYQLASFCHWSPINDFIISEDADFTLNFSSDSELAETAADYLKINDPKLCFLHFDDVDHAGHSYGFSPTVEEYINAIETTDTYVGTVINAIQERPNYDNEDWLIMSTTDHGGVGFGHGGTSLEHREVFIIGSGNNIEQSIITADSSYFVDQVFHCLGDSVSLSFQQNDALLSAFDDSFNFGEDKDFTIEVRIKTSSAADVAIIGNKDWDTGLNPGFVFSFKYPSGPEWKVNIGDGSSRVDIDNGGLIADGQWHLLTASFDRDDMMRLYQDGVFLEEADISGIGSINTNGGIFAGSDINQAYDFNGNISEIRIWDGVIDAETINAYNCQKIDMTHPNYNRLIANWNLNNDLGGQTISSIPHNIPAELHLTEWESKDSILIISHVETPRLVDIPPTILQHLCIPKKDEWQLEGKNLIEGNCISSDENLFDTDIEIIPNPFNDVFSITSSDNKECILIIIDQYGNTILKDSFKTHTKLDFSIYPSGIYFINLINENRKYSKPKKIVKYD